MKKIILKTSALIIALTLIAGCSGNKESLQFSLKVNKSYSILISKQIKTYEQLNNTTYDLNQQITTGFSFLPKEITPSGEYVVEGKILSISIDQESDNGKVVYDSEKGSEVPLIASPYYNLLNKSFIMIVKKDGAVLSVKGMEQNIAKAFEGFKIQDEDIKKYLERTIEDQYSNEALLETFERMLAFYPGKIVNPGETWNRSVSFTNHLPFIMNNDYKLIEQNNGVSVIEVNSTLRTDKDKITKNPGKFNEQNLVGQQKGKLMIDQISGWVTKAFFNYKIYDTNPVKKADVTRIISSEISVNFEPLRSSAFRDIIWSPGSIMKGDGIGMTVIGMGVVFISLVLLYLVFMNITKALNRTKKEVKSHQEPEKATPAKKEELTGEINAAIAIALHLYDQEVHDEENTVLTIQRTPRFYSPWSSKIYGLRKYPRQ